MPPRLFIFAGRFGSGKTETSANFAVHLAQGKYPTANGWGEVPDSFDPQPVLVDLDIVTPYFRSRELVDTMRPFHVQVVSPAAVSRYLDTPAITPQILGAIEQEQKLVVLDAGGDPQGARALGQYSPYIDKQEHQGYFLVNPFRPFTDSVEKIRQGLSEIERTARLRMTALVSNPNLMEETTPEVIVSGHREVERAAEAIGLPIALLCAEREHVEAVRASVDGLPILPINRFFDLGWRD